MAPAPQSEIAELMEQAAARYHAGDLTGAAEAYGAVLKRQPDRVDAWFNLATLLQSFGQPEAAVRGYDQTIALRPDHADAWLNRGVALKTLGQAEAALDSYDRAVALRPDYPLAYNNRGNLLKQLGRADAARADYDRAIALQPAYASAYSNRGVLKADLGDYAAGLVDYERALACDPSHAETWFNRGNALWELGRAEEALVSYERAAALRPGYVDAHLNRGGVLKELRRSEAAIECFDTVLTIAPGFAEARFNKALCRLQLGQWDQAWQDYESRWGTALMRGWTRPFPQPHWQGEDLAGRTLLLHAEQGLGDTLQFCRYVPLVAARGGRVVLEVQPGLRPLLAGLTGVARMVERGEDLPPFDLHCPLLSLPRLFATAPATIPPLPPGLAVPPERLAAWRARLGPATRPRIGLAWRGSPVHQNDRHRSLTLAQIGPLREAGTELISLQKEVRAEDAATLPAWPGLRHFGSELTDFADTAALCELCDLVIAVDTSVAHLAATLGRPTWILLPARNTDWRWLLDRDDSPWYPAATLYRQQRGEPWPAVVGRVAADLDRFFSRSPA